MINPSTFSPAHAARHDPMVMLAVAPQSEGTHSQQSARRNVSDHLVIPIGSHATEAELAGMVADKTYFLPIGPSQTRHYRVGFFFAMLVLLIVIIWLDAAEDNGLIHVSVLWSLNHVLHHIMTFGRRTFGANA